MALRHRTLTLGPFETNAYLVWCDRTLEAAVLDVGFEPEVVRAAVREAGVKVTRLLLTHAHYDHAAAMRDMEETFGLPVALHPDDRPMLEALAVQGSMFGLPPVPVPRDVRPLADGERLALGEETLEVLHTPGHSPGGVCFVGGGHAWVGDTLFREGIGRTDLWGGSFELLERSIRTRLFPLGDDLPVHPGHGPDTTIGHERIHNPFVGRAARFA